MVDQIRTYIGQYHMIEEKDTVLAGVSGGADSVCLLLVLRELQKRGADFSLKVIHVEHGIRGEASRKDAAFVEKLCSKLGVELFFTSVSVPDYAKEHRLGDEEAARIMRYQAFIDVAEKLCKQGTPAEKIKIALAHHRNDNAETVLFQMIRGSGLTGMCGMQPVRYAESGICYIRPLLCVERADIEAYLDACGQTYCTDETNFELDYSRNRIRNLVIPELLTVNPQAVAHICQTAERLGEVQQFLIEEAGRQYKKLVTETERVVIDAAGLSMLPSAVAKEVIRLAVFAAAGKRKDIAAVHIRDVLSLCSAQSGKKIMLPYGLTAEKEYDRICIEKEAASSGEESPWEFEVLPDKLSEKIYKIPLPDNKSMTLQVRKFSGNIEEIPKKPYTKWLDYDMIKNGFLLRRRRPGDYFYIGCDGKKKKLKEYFVNEKIPQRERNSMILLARESEILCIPGGRISASCLVNEHTRYILEIIYNGGK